MSVLAKRIKERREKLGYSQDELAKKLGYKSRSTIAKIEAGKNDIPQSKIKAFADALQTTPGYLLGWAKADNELAEIMHAFEVFDAKVSFHSTFRQIIKTFGYTVEERFGEDKDGNTTVLFESENEKFEIKESDYDEFFNNAFSFIDFGLSKLIKEENRVVSDYFIACYQSDDPIKPIHEIVYDYLDKHSEELNAAHTNGEPTEEDIKKTNEIMDNDENWD